MRIETLSPAPLRAAVRPPLPDTPAADPDIERLARTLAASGAVAISLHRPRQPPRLMASSGLGAGVAEAATRALDGEIRFERRRRAEHERLHVALFDELGAPVELVGFAFPVARDAVLLLVIEAPDALPVAMAEAYLDLWWQRRCASELNEGFRCAVNLLDLGIVLLDGAGSLLFANVRADRLLDTGDGLRRLGTTLGATAFEDAVRLQTAIGMALQADSGCGTAPPVMLRRQHGRPIVALVVRCPATPSQLCDPAALVYLLDPDTDTDRLIGPVCEGYGLTVAESQLVRSLVSGATLTEAAELQRIRPDTARTYLKQVFAKTGTHRQAELVRIMLSGILRAGPAVVRL
jgi:DNA-binding CsgD family transcriptional regulator/PAS domain-containing protein